MSTNLPTDLRNLPALLRAAERRVNAHVFRTGGDDSLASIPANLDRDVDLLLMEAADEIDRLRADLAIQTVNATAVLQAQHERDCAVEHVKRFAVEIERIASDCPMSAGTRTRLRKLIAPADDVSTNPTNEVTK